MWEIAIIAVLVLIAAVLILAASRPNTFKVQRSAVIGAPSERIFPLIEDFNKWPSWSPYERLDPQLKRSFGGAARGKGAVYEWEGNSKAGKGRIEITEAVAPARVTMKLDMIKPFEGHNIVDFTLDPQGNATLVTWAMRGASPFMAKLIGLFCNMDKMIGREFETGLGNLKALTEKP
jgi:hypothetical protein